MRASVVFPSLIKGRITEFGRTEKPIANTRINMTLIIGSVSIKDVLGLPIDLGLKFWQFVQSFVPPAEVIIRLRVETGKPQVDHLFLCGSCCVSDTELALELIG